MIDQKRLNQRIGQGQNRLSETNGTKNIKNGNLSLGNKYAAINDRGRPRKKKMCTCGEDGQGRELNN